MDQDVIEKIKTALIEVYELDLEALDFECSTHNANSDFQITFEVNANLIRIFRAGGMTAYMGVYVHDAGTITTTIGIIDEPFPEGAIRAAVECVVSLEHGVAVAEGDSETSVEDSPLTED